MRSHQNLHFYKKNSHFFKSDKSLHVWISSKSAGDGGVTTVVLRRPPPGTPPGGRCKGGVRGVNPQRVRIIASFFSILRDFVMLAALHKCTFPGESSAYPLPPKAKSLFYEKTLLLPCAALFQSVYRDFFVFVFFSGICQIP